MTEVWTVGHGQRDFADLERELAANGITTLVDVRSQPFSRRAPEFTKAPLEEQCADASIHYRWLGDRLGGRPGDPSLRSPSGTPDLEAIAASEAFRGGIEELAAVAAAAPTAIMCAERDPGGCHRATLVAPALEARGIVVTHLLEGGRSVRHQSELPL